MKLSANRSGFEREEFDRYLQELDASKRTDNNTEGYSSKFSLLVVDIPPDIGHDINQLAEGLDALSCRRLPGWWIKVQRRQIYVMCDAALGNTAEQILRVV